MSGTETNKTKNVELSVLTVWFAGGIAAQQAIGFRVSVEWALGFLLAIVIVVLTIWLVNQPPKAAVAYLLLVLVFFIAGCLNATRIAPLNNKRNVTSIGATSYRKRQTGWEKARDRIVNAPPVTAARNKIEVACRECLR